jgi:hypothetical protein
MLGYTYSDHFIQGWSEQYISTSSAWSLDIAAADAPPEGEFDSASYGRWSADGTMSVTGGTALGTTATGTIIVTANPGTPTFTTAAGDWPMDLDWNGERVTVTAAPAGSTSPQTLTITARGVAPSVARAHVAGEQIDVWTAATFSP